MSFRPRVKHGVTFPASVCGVTLLDAESGKNISHWIGKNKNFSLRISSGLNGFLRQAAKKKEKIKLFLILIRSNLGNPKAKNILIQKLKGKNISLWITSGLDRF